MNGASRKARASAPLDIASAWANIRAAAGRLPTTPGFTVATRAGLERPPVAKGDGRRKRATGRTAQLNLKVRAADRDRFKQLAATQGVGLAEMFERLLASYGEGVR